LKLLSAINSDQKVKGFEKLLTELYFRLDNLIPTLHTGSRLMAEEFSIKQRRLLGV